MSITLRYLSSLHVHSGRMSISCPDYDPIFSAKKSSSRIISGLNCVPGLWRIIQTRTILNGFGNYQLARDDLLFVHDDIDPCSVDLEGDYRFLRQLVNTCINCPGELNISDSLYSASFNHTTLINFPEGAWSLKGDMRNGTKVHTNDWANSYFLLSQKLRRLNPDDKSRSLITRFN